MLACKASLLHSVVVIRSLAFGTDAEIRQKIAQGNLRRAWIAGLVIVPVHFAHSALFLWRNVPGAHESWRQEILLSHLFAGLFWIPALVLIRWQQRRSAGVSVPGHVLPFGLAFAYVFFGAVICLIDQQVYPSAVAFFAASAGVALIFRMPPPAALLIFGLGLTAVWSGLGFSQADEAIRLSLRVNCLSAAGLATILSITFWSSELRMRLQNRQIEEQRAALEALAVRDPLTGLYNRRKFMEELNQEINRIRRTGAGGSMLLFDLDYFKQINDRYGHLAGDRALRIAGETIAKTLRTTDTVARFGGEEFIALLPLTDRHGATESARRVLEALRQLAVESDGQTIPIRASCGVATIQSTGEDPEGRTIQLADQALYRAKEAGRDQVAIEQSGAS